jgi:type IV secretion system protein VirB9
MTSYSTGRGAGQRVTMLRSASFALLMLGLSHAAHAQIASVPEPGPGDPRIKQFVYNPDEIVAVQAQIGYEMTIEFDPNERIENVSIGDSLSWQVTPNRKATLLFLKPMAKGASTSMTVVTTQRIYSFLLTAVEGRKNDPNQMLRLRFIYPRPPAETASTEPPPPPPRPEDFNFDYSNKGAKALYPVRVFDDGRATYFQFDAKREAPAVFFIAQDGKEEIANTRIQGAYTVADVTAEFFVLRYGKTKADVRNNAWKNRPASAPAPLPQPRGG